MSAFLTKKSKNIHISVFFLTSIVVLLPFVLLSSCVSISGLLPKPKSNNDTLLVIKLNRKGTSDIHSDYILYTKEGGMIKINTKRNLELIRGLSPGAHTIDRVRVVHREYKRTLADWDLADCGMEQIPFYLSPGKITIFPCVLQIAM